MGHLCLIGLLSVLMLFPADAVSDMDDIQTETGLEFIYHHSYNLLLTVSGSACYFTPLADLYANRALSTTTRKRTENMVSHLLAHSSRATRSSLNDMRSMFQDILADFKCTGKDVYRLDLKGDDFVRSGILQDYMAAGTAQP
ncbi:uncharacterized protein LOC143285899 [Babylonia areolata]|uniref:uncharacterized protein LOC143285899 n=1 Tax=Babylonia areolata TaxID=304850 RepID=UPI003FD41B90